MPRQVIVLEQIEARKYRCVMWVSVPVARRPFIAALNQKTEFLNATQAEKDALTNGEVFERVTEIEASTIAGARTELEKQWERLNNEIINTDRWSRYGTSWDGTTWTTSGV